MTTYAGVSDVEVELGRPISTEEETAQVTRWLERAEGLIRARISDLDDQVTAGTIDENLLIWVEAAAVARKAINPEGLRSVTRSIDDGSVTKVRDSALSDGVLRITDEEWAMLIPSRPRGAFTIRLGQTW